MKRRKGGYIIYTNIQNGDPEWLQQVTTERLSLSCSSSVHLATKKCP